MHITTKFLLILSLSLLYEAIIFPRVPWYWCRNTLHVRWIPSPCLDTNTPLLVIKSGYIYVHRFTNYVFMFRDMVFKFHTGLIAYRNIYAARVKCEVSEQFYTFFAITICHNYFGVQLIYNDYLSGDFCHCHRDYFCVLLLFNDSSNCICVLFVNNKLRRLGVNLVFNRMVVFA